MLPAFHVWRKRVAAPYPMRRIPLLSRHPGDWVGSLHTAHRKPSHNICCRNLIAAFLRENPSVSITPVIRRRECRSVEGGQSRLWICKANGVAVGAELFGEASRSAEIGFPETRWPSTRSRSMPRGDHRCNTLKVDIDNVKTMWDLSRSERTSNQR